MRFQGYKPSTELTTVDVDLAHLAEVVFVKFYTVKLLPSALQILS